MFFEIEFATAFFNEGHANIYDNPAVLTRYLNTGATNFMSAAVDGQVHALMVLII
jgi:hypothetical protein